jgi:hypothetical protein
VQDGNSVNSTARVVGRAGTCAGTGIRKSVDPTRDASRELSTEKRSRNVSRARAV